jgi:hypothetical protein
MLQADNATTAREAARAFSDPRVRQYHDPGRIVGTAFARAAFPGYLTQAASTLPEGDPLRLHLETRPADSPLWDVYLFYDPGADWKTDPPRPSRWIKQVMFDREEGSLIWENDFTRAPRMVDLVKAIEVAANE